VPPGVLRAFDIVSMPPSSLVADARCSGDYYETERGVGLPVGLRYTFP
jgi:CRISPR-associated protein Csc1